MDLTSLIDRPLDIKLRELRELLPRLATDESARNAVGSLLTDHVITAVREASTDELAAEADCLTRFVTSSALNDLREVDLELVGWWFGLSQVLGLAERRVDRSAVEAILRSHNGKAGAVFAQIAAHAMSTGEPMARSDLDVEASDSHRSHILRELEDADLVTRFKQGSRTVIELGGVGRDVADSQALLASPVRAFEVGSSAVSGFSGLSLVPTDTPVAAAQARDQSPATAFAPAA